MSFPYKTARTRASAFTLVELMIVIAIIGVLASLVTVGVMKALEKAKDVSARLEISQIESAIAAAKQKLSLNGLPTFLVLYEDLPTFQTVAFNPMHPDYIGASAAFSLLTKIYESSNPLSWTPTAPGKKDWNGNTNLNEPNNGRIELYGGSALLFLLGGEVEAIIPNGSKLIPKFKGFILQSPKKPKGPFYEPTGNVWANGSNYFGIYDPKETEYAYFDSADYLNCYNPAHPISLRSSLVKPLLLKASTKSFINPRSFQLISAGKDQTFGKNFSENGTGATRIITALDYNAGTNPWALVPSPANPDTTGYDDISNFASTFLGKKDE